MTDSQTPPPKMSLRRLQGASRGQKIAWIAIVVSLLLLVLSVSAPAWLPVVARRLIPDRYIVAYAPEGLRDLIFDNDPLQTLPTAAPNIASDGADLLGNNPDVVIIGPAEQEVVSGSDPTAVATQALIPIGPTPSLTPAFQAENEEVIPPTPSELPGSVLLTGFNYVQQGWNQCGPATLSLGLSYWDIDVNKNDVSNAIKPHPEDSNTTPAEMVSYVESLGYGATLRVNGTTDLVKEFVAAGYPVLIERGFDELPDEGWMGHFMLIIGYDETEREFRALDTYWGLNRVHEDQTFPVEYWDYDNLDRVWRHFNRTYLVLHPPEDADLIAEIIGPDMDDVTMYVNALERTQNELRINSDDVFGWFNLGTILTELGDYESASTAYDEARKIGLPFRMLWYQFGLYEAYFQTGRYEDVLTLANIILDVTNYPESEEAYYYRGLVYAERGQDRAALREFNQALNYNPGYIPALEALSGLTSN